MSNIRISVIVNNVIYRHTIKLPVKIVIIYIIKFDYCKNIIKFV
nr:MAG TPA: hypothetical protein [Crassvirales sp.]